MNKQSYEKQFEIYACPSCSEKPVLRFVKDDLMFQCDVCSSRYPVKQVKVENHSGENETVYLPLLLDSKK